MIKACIFGSILLLSTAIPAQVVTLYAQLIPGLFQTDNQGAYDQVIQLVTPENSRIIHKVLPNNRANHAFKNCQVCCFSPANLNPDFYSFDQDVYMTQPINTAKAYIFSLKEDATYSSLSELAGKRVGLERGMNYGKAVADGDFIHSVTNTLLQNFKMLMVNRIDTMIAYEPDIYQAFKEVDPKHFRYNEKQPIAIHKDALVCRGVNESFISGFNARLNDLRNSGELKKVLGEIYVEP